MKSITKNERGIALILVIMMISVIVAVTLRMNRFSRHGVYGAANLRDGIRLDCMAKSGFNLAAALLHGDDNSFDSCSEDWARDDVISEITGDLFGEGTVTVTIEDEEKKIPVNNLVKNGGYNENIRKMLIRLLTLPEFALEEQEARDLVDALKDWIDGDDEITGFGAEDIYYSELDEPHVCKNASLDCIEELLMIKGMNRNMLYGAEDSPGIAEFITVFGCGRINVNTASRTVLRTLAPEITAEMAEELEEYRKNEDNDLSSPLWYRNVPCMAEVTIDPELISVKSDTFRVTSTGHLNAMNKSVLGIIARKEKDGRPKLLYWRAN